MQQRLSLKAYSDSASQNFPRFYWIRKFNTVLIRAAADPYPEADKFTQHPPNSFLFDPDQ
jgi:hypothetical protein